LAEADCILGTPSEYLCQWPCSAGKPIRYNNDNAQVTSLDDGSSFGKELKAGMVVSIEGSPVVAATTSGGTATATAYRIVCGSE